MSKIRPVDLQGPRTKQGAVSLELEEVHWDGEEKEKGKEKKDVGVHWEEQEEEEEKEEEGVHWEEEEEEEETSM